LEAEAAQKTRQVKKPIARKRKKNPTPVSSGSESEIDTPNLTDEEEAP